MLRRNCGKSMHSASITPSIYPALRQFELFPSAIISWMILAIRSMLWIHINICAGHSSATFAHSRILDLISSSGLQAMQLRNTHLIVYEVVALHAPFENFWLFYRLKICFSDFVKIWLMSTYYSRNSLDRESNFMRSHDRLSMRLRTPRGSKVV